MDFKNIIQNLLNGPDSQQGGRFGLKIQRHGPFIIEKPISVSIDGKKHTETRQVAVTKFRDNGVALEKFRKYLRDGYNLPIDGLSFDQLKKTIDKFFKDAPAFDLYGEEYEEEALYADSKVIDPNFRF